jgi:sugar lactone lactonase YvrE
MDYACSSSDRCGFHRKAAARVWRVFFGALMVLGGELAASARADSVFQQRPDDARAVYFSKELGAHADGITDDSAALQAALDRMRQGIVFIPEGKYRIAKTVYVPMGVRIIGYGATRPVFVLAPNTPGFQEGDRRYMFWFTDSRQADGTIVDASEFTFYSAMSNVDFDLQEGNPAAVAIRFHVAQHSFLSHIDFHLGTALAAMEDIGNQASDLHIFGGKYGIITQKTSPAWQFLLMDSSFENQSVAGIRTQEVGFTLVRCSFAHMPVAIEIPEGQVEQLYARDLRMEDIKVAAVKLGDAKNLRHEVTMENTACADVPHFLAGGDMIDAPARFYAVDHLSAGLEIGNDGREVGIVYHHKETPLQQAAPIVPSDIPALPPMDQWVNVHTLGVRGDGSDDTAALQAAVDGHRVLYLPSGNYRLTAPLRLRADSVLIGLHSATTMVSFAGQSNEPTGVIIGPKDGSPMLSGLGMGPGNPRAAGVLWMSGSKSCLDDVSFSTRTGGGFGRGRGAPTDPAVTPPATGAAVAPTAAVQAVAPDLLVTNGGGGVFRDIWLHVQNSGVGLRAENTSTPTRIYQLSNEHHARVEVQFNNVENWQVYCLQTEEENPAGADAIALDIQNCRNLLFGNTYMYRVSRNVRPKTYAVQVRGSEGIVFDNMKIFSQTRLAFDNPILDETSGVEVRSRDFTHFVVDKSLKKPAPLPLPDVFARDAKLDRLAGGFSNATSLTADDSGKVYFTDAADHKIYRWNDSSAKAELIGQLPNNQQPMVMSFVRPFQLLIVAYEKTVYSLDLTEGAQPKLVAETATPLPDTTLLLPVGLHNSMTVMQDMMNHHGYIYRQGSNTAVIRAVENEHRGYFYAPGTRTAIMAGGTWRPLLQSCGLAPFAPGEQRFLTSEDDARTWQVALDKDAKLTSKLFCDRGGSGVIDDSAGNVYVASSQVYIYDKEGRQTGILEVPERPSSLVLAGPDKQTLYITARGSLYAMRTTVRGK